MAEYLIQSETLDAIADAINAKTGGSSAMTPAQMVTAIGSISGGGEEVFYTPNGHQYSKNMVIPITTTASPVVGGLLNGAEYLETVRMISEYAPFSNVSTIDMLSGCNNLTAAIIEILSSLSARTLSSNHKLENVQLGRIGVPVNAIHVTCFKNNTQINLTITIYVADDATLPLTYSPWGATNATIIYRSATTGEVITV